MHIRNGALLDPLTCGRGLATVALFLALAGCGGGGASSVDTGPQPVPGTNGLDYGFEGQDIRDSEGATIVTPGASFRETSDPANGTVTLTLAPGFFNAAPTDQNATVTMFGETVEINGGEGFLSNGQTVRLLFDPANNGTYSAILSLVSYGTLEPGIASPIDGEQVVVFGYETDPTTIQSVLPGSLGVTTYSGDFAASGIVRDTSGDVVGDRGTQFDGSISFEIDFNSSRANGQIVGTYSTPTEIVPLTLNMGLGSYNDSGFTGTFNCPDCTENASFVEATFFGPAAEELGGVIAIDATSDVNGEDLQFTGVGGFTLSR